MLIPGLRSGTFPELRVPSRLCCTHPTPWDLLLNLELCLGNAGPVRLP